jgi:ubiquinol-cytochrome c reductase cytochrome c subunit
MLALIVLLLATATDVPASRGAELYATYCSSCHGVQKWGSANGPSLSHVGLASVDFYLTTGRMPAAVPWIQIEHRDERSGQQLALDDIRAIEDYLAPTVAGGPAIPRVIAGGDLQHGRRIYELNCEQCHNVNGGGGDLGKFTWVPALRKASINEVADAIRAGPGEMPQFGEHQLSQTDLDDVASYVMHLQAARQPSDVLPYRSTGPVPEGAVGYLAVIALVAFVFTFWRVDTPARDREEAVRRDDGKEKRA